jgi:hypothetical protein
MVERSSPNTAAIDIGIPQESSASSRTFHQSIPVRAALLFYFLKRLRLDEHESERLPKEPQIVLLNRHEILNELSFRP